MNEYNLIITYGTRLIRREWRRFVLPFVLLTITGVVLLLVLLLTSAGARLVAEEARVLLGGDIVFESAEPIDGQSLFSAAGVAPSAVSSQSTFTATFSSESGTAPFSVYAIDEAFPLYGEFVLQENPFRPLAPDEILLDASGAERLSVLVGDTVTFGSATYTVADIIVTEPTSLLAGFDFFPRLFMSQAGFIAAGVDPTYLRVEYRYAARVEGLDAALIERVRAREESDTLLDVDVAGQDQRGLQFGFATIADFLTIAVLMTAVLAAVNVYASTVYLVTVERKSLAILLALGVRKIALLSMIGFALFLVVGAAVVVSTGVGVLLFIFAQDFIATTYTLVLPRPPYEGDIFLTAVLLGAVTLSSFIPAVQRSLALNPRQILIGVEKETTGALSLKAVLGLTIIALFPLFLLATVLLGDALRGGVVMLIILLLYMGVAGLYLLSVRLLYVRRTWLPFFLRTIVAQKKADGLFGVVSFTSLFVAITALSTLTLLQVSLERFLVGDLQRTIPSSYIIDVQPSQRDILLTEFPEVTLFSNIGARLVSIDGLDIEAELAKEDTRLDRELGREFNLTARPDLLTSETITAGEWSAGRSGEVSVDEEFAARAGIVLGSTITFSIQGFPVTARVTSLRSTDSRSGLPFFYFVLSPQDIGMFPSVYFGYAEYDESTHADLGRFLAREMPNVSLVETKAIGPIVVRIIELLLVLVFAVTLPPLLIATFLIATLVSSTYAARRQGVARLRALGMTKSTAFIYYVTETVSTTFVAILCAYGVSCLLVLLLNAEFLALSAVVLFSPVLFLGIALILFFIVLLAVYLFKTDTMPLRALLSYE